ncbi:formyl transferase [Xylariaceae sp. FL0016]|nr:formyl transferase [Xylariaceae sp. FL0016]
MDQRKARISCLASGNGTNFQALIDACASGVIPGQIVKLVVNRKDAFAVKRAESAKPAIPTEYFNMVKHGFQTPGEKDLEKLRAARLQYDTALAERILADRPELIVLAGWMHVFTPGFLGPVSAAGVPVINLHPALPGKYDGAGAIKRAYEDFQAGNLENNKTGIMIHFVIEEVDRGAPILTQDIVIREGESLEDLEQRMHSYEHELIVKAAALEAEKIAKRKGLAAT